MKTQHTLIGLLLLVMSLSGCTTMQTTYFRGSMQPLEDVNDAGLYPFDGESQFRQVSNMSLGAKEMYNEGYAMVGYSQFVSPLFKSLAPSYATKYAKTIGAEYAVMETPQPGASNLHGYLVTYWAKVRPDAFCLGVFWMDLPNDLLNSLGQDYNVVYFAAVVPGTAAAEAGLQADDVLLAIDGQRVTSTSVASDLIRQSYGSEVTVSVSRYGKHLEIPVQLRRPAITTAAIGHHDSPWRYTAPRDWSMLSAANTTIRVLQYQQQQRDIQAAYERGRQQAYQASSNVGSAYSSYGVGSSDCGDSRTDRRSGKPGCAAQQQWSQDFNGAMTKYQNLDFTVMQGDSLQMVFGNYPSIYGQLFSYPAN